MADEQNENPNAASEEGGRKSKKGLLLGGGALALIATGAMGALLAVPKADTTPSFHGPFVMSLAPEGTQLQANLAGEKARRYLVMDLRVEYDAYQQTYGSSRIENPLYIAKLQDRLLTISSQKTADEVLERGTQEIFLQQLVEAVEPILFPVHLGNAVKPTDADVPSGLRPGLMHFESTMRDPLHKQKIRVDAPNRTLRLGQGEEYQFQGTEENLVLRDEQGRTVYVDVTEVKKDFVGEIQVGVKGRIRHLYKSKFIIQ
jgi:hypothetical protein